MAERRLPPVVHLVLMVSELQLGLVLRGRHFQPRLLRRVVQHQLAESHCRTALAIGQEFHGSIRPT